MCHPRDNHTYITRLFQAIGSLTPPNINLEGQWYIYSTLPYKFSRSARLKGNLLLVWHTLPFLCVSTKAWFNGLLQCRGQCLSWDFYGRQSGTSTNHYQLQFLPLSSSPSFVLHIASSYGTTHQLSCQQALHTALVVAAANFCLQEWIRCRLRQPQTLSLYHCCETTTKHDFRTN